MTGSGRDNYTIRVQLSGKDGRILKAECSCPHMHGYCKHEVAVALAALADPTLRSAESAGWGRILDDAEEVAQEFAGEEEAEERLVVRLGLPLNPDDSVRVRFFKARFGKKGRAQEKPIPAETVRAALATENDILGLKHPEEALAARVAGLLEANDEHTLLADEANLDLLLRSLSRMQELYLGDTDKRLHIKLDPVRPRVRVDALKNGGLSLKIQVIINGKRRTLDKRSRVAGSPLSAWLFDGESGLMPMLGGPGSGVIVYGLSRRQARMPPREVPTFLERGLIRMKELIRVEAEPGVLPDVGEVEPLLILGEDGDRLKVQLQFRYGDPVELQVFNEAAPAVLRSPEGHEPPFVIRNREAEGEALQAAREAGLPVGEHPQTVLLDTADALTFLEEQLDGLGSHWTILGRERLQRFLYRAAQPTLIGSIRSTVDAFECNLGIDIDGSRFGLDALLQLYQSGKRYITLQDGSLALVPDEWVTRHLHVAMELPHLLIGGGVGRVPRFHAPVLDALVGDAEIEGDAEWTRLSTRLRNFKGLNDEPLPKGLTATLREYQKHGYDWLCFLRDSGFHGILADDMGLGKTIQALTFVLAEKEAGRLENPVLVVTPTSVTANWVEEARRFTPDLNVVRLVGPNRDKLYKDIKDTDVVITTFALLRLDINRLSRRAWAAVILDEAQHIKNPASQTALAAKKLTARQRLALTGTPLENSLIELWSIFDFLMPGFLDTEKNFASRYVRSGAEKPEDIEGLRIKVAPFMLRRVKSEVAKELPPKTEQIIHVPLTPRQQELYDEVRALTKQKVMAAVQSKGLAASTITILDALLKLRQVACHPRLVKLDVAAGIEESAKHDILHELLEEAVAEGHRALVFSQFTSHLAIVREWLDASKIPYFYLDGRTRKRQALVDRFNAPDGPPLFLISLKAGGTGLNLATADYVIHLDPWWNPAVEDQATDRAHRIGQTQPVFVYKLVAEGTVEEKILQLQESKRELFDAVVAQETLAGSGLTAEDIRSIFDD
ncbi:MAG: SNF2 helicase associated domain-containing protein [Deltaproteobacteria bacterium]|nr:SNF2 helicase associated domain-containing protein [Deltaproteobacteria bacterium]MCB9788256.1 SNF2 helicase associated domain-containing protein [Deltaproteobacteria bacterium]